jgi:hypothetical protein
MKTEQYKKEYCDMLIRHMEMGYSFGSFGAEINHGRTTLYAWLKNHEEFKEAYEIGYAKALKVFETILSAKIRGKDLTNVDVKKADTACLIFGLKTRFKEYYSEKVEVELGEESRKSLKLAYKID